jgi:hypothetical protein
MRALRPGLVLLALVWAGATPPVASGASITATPGIVARGAAMAVTGQAFTPGRRGTARLSGARRVRFRVDSRGRVAAVLQLRRSTRPGRHRLIVRAGRRRVSTVLTVVSAPRAPSTLVALSGGQRALLAPAQGVPGGLFGLRASGLGRRARVSVRVAAAAIAAPRASRRGAFSISAPIPAVTAGVHRVRVASGRTRMSLRLQVTFPPAPPAPAPAPAPTPPPAPAGPTAVIAAAGDIACSPADLNFNGGRGVAGFCQQRATGSLMNALGPAAVLGLGDMQYESGSAADFRAVYRPTWGALDPKMFPVPGNHDYLTAGAAGFFSYFGARAGPRGRGYYSFDVGTWHIVALNSNCQFVPCATGSAQDSWLRADLAAHANACTLAFFHHPLFSSGHGVGEEPVTPLWDALYAAGADLVVVGHSHNYERFAPQTPAGAVDAARGIREFVVGTGGQDLQPFQLGVAPNSEARSQSAFGVLQLTLRPTGYDWRFVPIAGAGFSDAGTAGCH